MCLSSLADIKHSNIKRGIGWKCFHESKGGKLYGEYFAGNSPRPTNKWMKSNNGKIDGGTYEKGFHVFLNKKDALFNGGYGLAVRKVKFRNITAKGYQSYDQPCIVAKEMLILPESKQ